MIHGRENAVGYIPVGEEAIEEIFILAAKIGVGNVKIIITPYNLPGNGKVKTENVPMCYPKLLEEIKNELKKYLPKGLLDHGI